MKLTAKHQAFIAHYLTCWIGAEAARRTDPTYKRPDQVAYEYLRKPEIQAEIQRRLAELKMGADETLTRLSDQARGSIADFIEVSEPSADLENATDVQDAKAIAGGWRSEHKAAALAAWLVLHSSLRGSDA
jgi:phage terminase small subunit